MAERTDADSIEGRETSKNFDQRSNCRVAFGIDVDRTIGKLFEQIAEQRNWFFAVDLDSRNLIPGHFVDAAFDAAGSLQVVVVECHQVPVGGELDIGLEITKAPENRIAKCRQGVFG